MTTNTNPPIVNMPDVHPKHHSKLIMVIFIVVAVIVATLLVYLSGWMQFEYDDGNEQVQRPDDTSFENEIDGIDEGNLDQELMDIDAQINAL
jgi:hypothetical protein